MGHWAAGGQIRPRARRQSPQDGPTSRAGAAVMCQRHQREGSCSHLLGIGGGLFLRAPTSRPHAVARERGARCFVRHLSRRPAGVCPVVGCAQRTGQATVARQRRMAARYGLAAGVCPPPPLKSTIWATAEDKQLPPTASAARQASACRVACCQRGHAGVDHVHTPCRHSAVDGTPRQPSRGRSAPPPSAHPWRLYLAPPAVPPERGHAGPRWPIKSSGTDCLQLACQLRRDERAPVCEIVRNCSQKTSLTEMSCQTSREIGKQATIRCDG